MSNHLTLAVITLFVILFPIETFSREINDKFHQEEIVPDVLSYIPDDLKLLKISYPARVKVSLGNILTPTQTKEQPKVEWDGGYGAYYTLVMTGEFLR